MHPIYALWCHPRSMSTAIERVMRERGDLRIVHEPFIYTYYLGDRGRSLPHFEPNADHPQTYVDVRQFIRDQATIGPVFFKDMTYYALENLLADPEFLSDINHTFLVRDPAAAILSYARLDPLFRRDEAGLEASWTLYCKVRDDGHDPLVLSADHIRMRPAKILSEYWSAIGLTDAPHALSWSGEMPESWEHVAGWHEAVLASRQIRPPEQGRDYLRELENLGGDFLDYYNHHRPFYDRLLAEALT